MKDRIKAIIFDVGGVLVLGKYALHPKREHRELGVHEHIVKKLGISLDQYFDSLDTAYAKSIEGKISKQKALKTISKNLEISKRKLERVFIKAYKENFKQNKELYNLAFKLKKQGYKIAILSDQWYLSKEALISKKYTKKFNVVVVSCDVGIRKPNSKIYKLVLRKLKFPAKNTVFIDNQEWNLNPAKKIGMNAILFKNNKQLFKELKKLGVRSVWISKNF
tara:strand:- start:5065 stop:5727 length:663 start_codon:yes stop_codon:yes gene_type:complete